MRIFLAFVLLFTGAGRPLPAQPHRLPPRVIGQMVDAVLQAVIPPDSSLSRVPVRERGLYFDFTRTLAEFGYTAADSVPPSALGLTSTVTPGTYAVIGDCNQVAPRPCDQLGWHAYVFVKPLSVSVNRATVQLDVSWSDRGAVPFEAGAAPGGRAFLYFFAMEVHLVRTHGIWKFARVGRAMVGD